jgi:predicted DNA-binding transcriptional regulator AlpA
VTLTEVADLQERLTGVRPARATIRSYLSRGQMPAQVEPGLWADPEIREWLRGGRMRRDPDTLTRVLDRVAAAGRSDNRPALDRAVQAARKAGASWAVIAAVLGVSRQAAWKRYRAGASA